MQMRVAWFTEPFLSPQVEDKKKKKMTEPKPSVSILNHAGAQCLELCSHCPLRSLFFKDN